ncbi:hypothetical protein V8352_21850 [Roseovarius sp. D0-M9]
MLDNMIFGILPLSGCSKVTHPFSGSANTLVIHHSTKRSKCMLDISLDFSKPKPILGFFAVCVGVRVSGQFTTTPDVVS